MPNEQIAVTRPPRAESAMSPALFASRRSNINIWQSNETMTTAVKMAEYLSAANIIPEQYRRNPGDCLVAMDLAFQMGRSPSYVMQNTQVVYGNLTWKGSACKALIDESRKYSNLRYEFCGKPGDWGWGCRLVAENSQNVTVQGPWVTMAMARDEGWFNKKGSKWRTMAEVMMRYRAAAFFARTECPEVLSGMQTAEEQMDIGPKEPPKEPTTYEEVKFEYDVPEIQDVPDAPPEQVEEPVADSGNSFAEEIPERPDSVPDSVQESQPKRRGRPPKNADNENAGQQSLSPSFADIVG